MNFFHPPSRRLRSTAPFCHAVFEGVNDFFLFYRVSAMDWSVIFPGAIVLFFLGPCHLCFTLKEQFF